MAQTKLADSSLLVAHLRRQPGATQFIAANRADLLVPFIVAGELISGALLSDRPEIEKPRVESLLSAFPRLWPDDATVGTFAEIRAEILRAGTPIGAHDLWLAAFARQHNFTIVSRDKDFSRVRGVQVIDW